MHDVQGCKGYRAGEALEKGQHHDCNQASAKQPIPALASQLV